MNTCLKNLYLKINQIDFRYIRLAIMVLALALAGSGIMCIPISGDVGI